MNYLALLLLILAVVILVFSIWQFWMKDKSHHNETKNKYLKSKVPERKDEANFSWSFWDWLFESEFDRRRDYYLNVYLKSDEWKRKRYVVLKRDNWRCRYCGGHATQVHHLKYAKRNIGKEPIEWLVSVCKSCHDAQHQ